MAAWLPFFVTLPDSAPASCFLHHLSLSPHPSLILLFLRRPMTTAPRVTKMIWVTPHQSVPNLELHILFASVGTAQGSGQESMASWECVSQLTSLPFLPSDMEAAPLCVSIVSGPTHPFSTH